MAQQTANTTMQLQDSFALLASLAVEQIVLLPKHVPESWACCSQYPAPGGGLTYHQLPLKIYCPIILPQHLSPDKCEVGV
jgi:hypothetical protein